VREFPLIAHDLTEVRRRGLLRLAAEFNEQAHVEQAVQVFHRERSDVGKHIYSDVLDCLEYLHSMGMKLCVLSNGSADLDGCNILNKYLSLSLFAGDVGASKPSPVGFIACAQRMGVPPSRVLFVGDSYEADVLGAKNAGMISALLVRENFDSMTASSKFDAEHYCARHSTDSTGAAGSIGMLGSTSHDSAAGAGTGGGGVGVAAEEDEMDIRVASADHFAAADVVLRGLSAKELEIKLLHYAAVQDEV
jgi:HAD superfamily hydrolase (TIGR01549 family)